MATCLNILLIASLISISTALVCRCTKESGTVKCHNEECETDGFCLMLKHPDLGQHYTCHTRGLSEGKCVNKTAKSGSVVQVCGCGGYDLCNVKIWPNEFPAGNRTLARKNLGQFAKEPTVDSSRSQRTLDDDHASALSQGSSLITVLTTFTVVLGYLIAH